VRIWNVCNPLLLIDGFWGAPVMLHYILEIIGIAFALLGIAFFAVLVHDTVIDLIDQKELNK